MISPRKVKRIPRPIRAPRLRFFFPLFALPPLAGPFFARARLAAAEASRSLCGRVGRLRALLAAEELAPWVPVRRPSLLLPVRAEAPPETRAAAEVRLGAEGVEDAEVLGIVPSPSRRACSASRRRVASAREGRGRRPRSSFALEGATKNQPFSIGDRV